MIGSDPADLILHVGAPKCGSSALQSALSLQPDGQNASGTTFRYVGYHVLGKVGPVTFTGDRLTKAARASRHGYAAWPNIREGSDADRFWQAMHNTARAGRRKRYTPILSNEGWFAQAADFSRHLLASRGLTADVVVFVRPPLDWLNAAYWQWGVWSGLGIDAWLAHPATAYRLGAQTAAWAAAPGVRLRLRSSTDNVVAGFSQMTGLDLAEGQVANASTSPALLGFLLRNRRFRPSAHSSWVEFAVQRWCPAERGARPWAIRRAHMANLWPRAMADVALMQDLAGSADVAETFRDDRWTRTDPYEALLDSPSPPLDDPEALVALFNALLAGIVKAAAAANRSPPPLPEVWARATSLADRDLAIASALDILVSIDAIWRDRGSLLRKIGRYFERFQSTGTGDRVSTPVQLAPVPSVGDTMKSHQVFLKTPGPSEIALRARFQGQVVYSGGPPVVKQSLILIAGAPQAGAGHIGTALRDSGRLGWGGCLFSPQSLSLYQSAQPATTFPDHVRQMAQHLCPEGQMLCSEVEWEEIAMLRRWNILAMFPEVRVIELRRDDTVLQAALHYIVTHTGREPVFAPDELARALSRIRLQSEMTALVLQTLELPTIRLSLEQFRARPTLHLNRLLSFCGVASGDAPVPQMPPPGPAEARAVAYAAAFRSFLREAMVMPLPVQQVAVKPAQ